MMEYLILTLPPTNLLILSGLLIIKAHNNYSMQTKQKLGEFGQISHHLGQLKSNIPNDVKSFEYGIGNNNSAISGRGLGPTTMF